MTSTPPLLTNLHALERILERGHEAGLPMPMDAGANEYSARMQVRRYDALVAWADHFDAPIVTMPPDPDDPADDQNFHTATTAVHGVIVVVACLTPSGEPAVTT